MKKIARTDAQRAIFLTLTYPESYPDPKQAKNDLRAFMERIRRRWPESSGIWRLEFQKRGAPHFHVVLFGIRWLPFRWAKAWWADIIAEHVGETLPFVRVESIRSRRRLMNYVSKYVAKADDPERSDAFFNNGAYLHAGSVGRWWGVFNRHYLPMAAMSYAVFTDMMPKQLAVVKRHLRRSWAGVTTRKTQGAAIFTDHAYSIFSALIRQVINATPQELAGVDIIELSPRK
jgi:hypothetical protein